MPFPGRKYQRGQKSSTTEKTPAHRWGQPGAAAFLQPFRRPGAEMGGDLHRIFGKNQRAGTIAGLAGPEEKERFEPNAGKTARLIVSPGRWSAAADEGVKTL
jgi:hypothetical protein